MSRQERAQVKRSKRRRAIPEAVVFDQFSSGPAGKGNGEIIRTADGRFYQRWFGANGLADGSLRRVFVASAEPIKSAKAERGPAAEPSIREEIRAAGAGARELYESKVAVLSLGTTYGPSADTKRKWLRVVERLERAS